MVSTYIGIDLAGRTTNRTSLAVITTTTSKPKLSICGKDPFKGKRGEEADRYLIQRGEVLRVTESEGFSQNDIKRRVQRDKRRIFQQPHGTYFFPTTL